MLKKKKNIKMILAFVKIYDIYSILPILIEFVLLYLHIPNNYYIQFLYKNYLDIYIF